MSAPIDRLRAADPAAGVGPQPDERAEADLRVLLAEPRAATRPAGRRERRHRAPVLATAFVALAVVALTAAVLGLVRPRVDVGSTTTASPSGRSAVCDPYMVRPFVCGTYRSVQGGAAITGSTGGPDGDALSISFTARGNGYLLRAVARSCFSATVPVRLEGTSLLPDGEPSFGSGTCRGAAVNRTTWAYDWVQEPHTVTPGALLLFDFTSGGRAVNFSWEGDAHRASSPLPGVATCIGTVADSSRCGDYRSSGGTGALAFLGMAPHTIHFSFNAGELRMSVTGGCPGTGYRIAREADDLLVVVPESESMVACGGGLASREAAVKGLFNGAVTYRVEGDRIVFTKGSSSATFTREVGICGTGVSGSPFCGTSTVRAATGAAAFLTGRTVTLGMVGGRPTATVAELCDTALYDVAIDVSDIRFHRRAVRDEHSCPLGAGDRDVLQNAFLTGRLTYSVADGVLTLTSQDSGSPSSIELVGNP